MSFAVKDRFTWCDMEVTTVEMCAIKKIMRSWKNNGKQMFKFPSDIVLDLLELYRDYMACENVVSVVKMG